MTLSVSILSKLASLGYGHFKNRRVAKVLKDLESGEVSLENIINDENEIYKFTIFLDSLNKASTYAKANVLKDLYLSFNKKNDKEESNDDLFFEFFSILGELSDREVQLLYLLDLYYIDDIKKKPKDPNFSEYFKNISEREFDGGSNSDSFYYYVSDKMKIEPSIVSGLMCRLQRSGLIESTGIDGNANFQEYRFTALYSEIKTRLFMAMENTYNESLRITASNIG